MANRVSHFLRELLQWALPHRRRLRVAPVVVKAVAAVAACYALSATSAFATCGDWLAHAETPAIEESVRHEADNAADSPTTEDVSESKPCSGPFCEGTPSLPAAPVPAPAPTVVDQFASLQEIAEGSEHDGDSSRRVDSGATALPGFLMPIEHPPRA
jgi:hypothetical protein